MGHTLDAGIDRDRIRGMAQKMREAAAFPIPLHVTGLSLYHIWRPVKLVRKYGAPKDSFPL